MGIGIVLIFWAIAGTILASLGAAVFGGVAALLTKGSPKQRKAILFSAAFPLVCLGWAGILFIFQSLVNGALLHRDPGIGDTWECPLPNGYALLMIDVTDQGWVYNPKTQIGGGVGEQEDAVPGVRQLQVAGRYIFGAADSHFTDGGKPTDVDSYFLLDTSNGRRAQFKTYDQLAKTASQLGIQLDLKDIDSVYSKYRFTWFDVMVGVLLAIPIATYFLMLVRWIARLRKMQVVVPAVL